MKKIPKDVNYTEWLKEQGLEKEAEEFEKDLKRIREIKEEGHSYHCACRQVWGDGECECDLYERGYDPYAWIKRIFKK